MANSTTNDKNYKNKKQKSSSNANSSEQKSLGLASISYADYVILSSTLAFALSEELNDEDLSMLIAFLAMISSDLAMLTTKKGINKLKQQTSKQQLGADEGAIIAEESVEGSNIIVSGLSRTNNKKSKKKKYIKKVKRKKKKEK
ncbi:hypothetical protein [Romboutsia maritimum]|uniref:hypothetical protein n=1 Tax=Romboutsia maritimum TaxID=2020948 RepID=UPI000BA5630F|nr:hypothetical protein [Romboutsia maritimum]